MTNERLDEILESWKNGNKSWVYETVKEECSHMTEFIEFVNDAAGSEKALNIALYFMNKHNI